MYDRGTKFGLLTPQARVDSVLMSLPLYAVSTKLNVPTTIATCGGTGSSAKN